MVAPTPREEIDHEEYVAHKRQQDDQTPDPEASRTLSGPEAVERESRRLSILLTQFRGHPRVDRHLSEQFQTETEALQRKAEQATKHNEQFVLAGNMRNVSRRLENLLAA
ncbi:MAG: hypothetical protein ABIG34_00910 [Candidatus Peregrinibacteria bacterium]